MAQTAAGDATIMLLAELDRADVSSKVKESLRQSVSSIARGYAEEGDPLKPAPDAKSFRRMLKFLEHPHRWSWRTPAITVNPQGMFSVIWDDPGVHRWLLDFPLQGGKIQETYLRTYPDGRIEQQSRPIETGDHIQPPFRIY
jgi:hypothetical protein